MEGMLSSVEPGFGLILGQLSEVLVWLLSKGFSSWFTFQSLQWQTVVCLSIVFSFFVGLLFTLRLLRSVQSRLYVRLEKQLAKALAAQIEEKCRLIDKIYAAVKENAEMETSLKKASLERESLNIPGLTETFREMLRINVILMEELNSLAREPEKERVEPSKQKQEMVEMVEELEFLEEVMRTTTSHGSLKPSRRPSTKP